MKLVVAAEGEKEGGTEQSLQRIDPKLGCGYPERSVGLFNEIDRAKQEDEEKHRQHVGEENGLAVSWAMEAAGHRREDKRVNRSAKRHSLGWVAKAGLLNRELES